MDDKPQVLGNVPDLNQTLLRLVLQFLKEHEDGLVKRKLYVHPEDMGNLPLIPEGRAVQITFNLVSAAKLQNKAEKKV
jgi:hypothetical protein